MRKVMCHHCHGTGEEPHSKNKDYNGLSCLECNGMGERLNCMGEHKETDKQSDNKGDIIDAL
jgi:DnaJ-class molecular chaperone